MKLLLFGTGEYYNRYKIWLENEEVIALVDNAKEKQGKYRDGVFVIAPEDICQYEYDAIIIMSLYVREIKSQLVSLGVKQEKIHHFYDFHDLIYQPSMKRAVYRYGEVEGESGKGGRKKVLLLNQDLTLGGPALALYHAARILKKQGYQVVYGSMIDGPLREILLKEGIPVVVDENMLIGTMAESDWIRDFCGEQSGIPAEDLSEDSSGNKCLVICNTINYHVFLSERDKTIPVVWWLHDALFFYDGVNTRAIDRIEKENLKIWAVGPVAEKAVRTFRPDFRVENLLYGVENAGVWENRTEPREVMCFVTIGYIEYRKGQDLLLQAVMALEPEIRRKARFYFVGPNTSAMAGEIMEAARDIPEVIVTGPVGREEINRILCNSDMLVCPSREDPMPTVAAEAMMHKVPCLISDTAGTAAYIRDRVEGIIFHSGDVRQLKMILKDCILGRVDLKKMGENAHKIFEDYFSMDAFGRRLQELMEDEDTGF